MSTDPGATQWRPGKLWSLWDIMERVVPNDYWYLASEFQEFLGVIYMSESLDADDPGRPLTKVESDGIQKHFDALKALFQRLGLTTSVVLLDALKRSPPKSTGEMRMLHTAFFAEMKDKLFLFVPAHLAKYFERDPLTERARSAFPKANQELREASNAIAYGMPTAGVFHSMRAVEHGLGALASDLSVTTLGTDNWQNVIDQIQSAIKRAGDELPKGAPKSARMQFLSEAASDVRHFKDAWRNHVSHNKVVYTEAQAIKVIDSVQSFIEALSVELVEAP